MHLLQRIIGITSPDRAGHPKSLLREAIAIRNTSAPVSEEAELAGEPLVEDHPRHQAIWRTGVVRFQRERASDKAGSGWRIEAV